MMAITAQDLSKVFAVLQPDMAVAQKTVRPELYDALDAHYNGFKNHALVACHDFSEDWGTWEMHPAGDEIVVLLSGSATMVLWRDGAKESVQLDSSGAYVVIPRGIWHTAQVTGPTKMLFITPGQSTEHGGDPSEAQ
ncbi:MAG: cupin [Gammaproteobacteria bacterium]|nr:cupin [Gammaproteobacteria bacterium]